MNKKRVDGMSRKYCEEPDCFYENKEQQMSIPNEIYDNFFDLFDSGYTFKEAFIKSQLNKYMTDKEYIEKFRNDVEEIKDAFDKTWIFLNEKFLIEHPEILNPLKDKLLSISEEMER